MTESEQTEHQGEEQDDWIAGASFSAAAQPMEVGQVQIALNDLDLPDDGTAYA